MDSTALVPDLLPELLGAVYALAVCLGLVGFGRLMFSRWTEGLDPAARFGVNGLLGLGTTGTLCFYVGVIPHAIQVAMVIPPLAAVIGFTRLRGLMGPRAKPQGVEWLAVVVVGLAGLFAFIVLLAPSASNDWDSIAYHMALPKLYLANGEVQRLRFVSHSAFPEAVELLFLLPIKFGLQAGAKAFLLGYFLLGGAALFGLARERYGRVAGWWTLVAFCGTPVVLWESASAYIDVAHGLFAGLGAIFALRAALERRNDWILAGLCLGFACGTKYTGLQSTGLVVLLLVGLTALKKSEVGWKPIGALVGVAMIVGCPWYVRNILATGNPVYPFLYERFGGVDWDQKRADIYRDEQLSFGVGVDAQHKEWSQIGHAVFGLDYQPGRYVNPQQKMGLGEPLGAVGVAFFAGLLFWGLARKPGPLEAGLLGFTLLSFVLWFGLSQQSRYATTLTVPACLMLGGAAVSVGVGRLVALVASVQALYTLGLYKTRTVDMALPVAVGKVSQGEALDAMLPFAEAAKAINQLPDTSKVALYDQVFGYYLNRSYFWANPGHSSYIPYDSMHSSSDYVKALRDQGFTHVYVQFVDHATDPLLIEAMGSGGMSEPLPADLQAKWQGDWQQVWKLYLIESVQKGDIRFVQGFKSGALFSVQPS